MTFNVIVFKNALLQNILERRNFSTNYDLIARLERTLYLPLSLGTTGLISFYIAKLLQQDEFLFVGIGIYCNIFYDLFLFGAWDTLSDTYATMLLSSIYQPFIFSANNIIYKFLGKKIWNFIIFYPALFFLIIIYILFPIIEFASVNNHFFIIVN